MALRLIIRVNYEFVEGRHFFTAARQLGQGLCVAHSELKTALGEVGRQLKAILSQNHGFETSDPIAERRALEQIRRLSRDGARPQCRTIQIEWASIILDHSTA